MCEEFTNVDIKDFKQEPDDTECASVDIDEWLENIKAESEIGSSGTPNSVNLNSEQKTIKFEGFEIREYSNLDHRDEDNTMPKFLTKDEYVEDNIQKVLLDVNIKNEDDGHHNEKINAEEQDVAINSDDSKFIESSEKFHWYHCKFCDYTSKLNSSLVDHIRVEHDATGERYHCQICQYKTDKRNGFLEHIELKHDRTNSKENEYDGCRYEGIKAEEQGVARNSEDSKSIKEVESGETINWYHCKFCDYTSRLSSSLIDHIRLEHDEMGEWYHCQLCQYKTKNRDSFLKHIELKHLRASSNENESVKNKNLQYFYCQICDFKTTFRTSLKNHCKIKHNDSTNMYQCTSCDYTTLYKHNLKSHVLAKHCEHSQWQQCTFCNYKTKNVHTLRGHISRNHGDKVNWFRCALCEYKTKRKENLVTHVMRKHGGVA